MPPAVILGVSAAMSVGGGMLQGQAAQRQADTEARFLNAQAEMEKLGQLRDLDALDEEKDRTLARSRAVAAAGGGDLSSGTALDAISDQAGSFGYKRQALINDSDARIAGLYDRSASAHTAGKEAARAAVFSGLGKGLGTVAGGLKMPSGGDGAMPSGGFDSVGSLIKARGFR